MYCTCVLCIKELCLTLSIQNIDHHSCTLYFVLKVHAYNMHVCVCCSKSLFVELCSPGIYRCALLFVNSEVKAPASRLKTGHHVHLYMVYKLTCINHPLIFFTLVEYDSLLSLKTRNSEASHKQPWCRIYQKFPPSQQ